MTPREYEPGGSATQSSPIVPATTSTPPAGAPPATLPSVSSSLERTIICVVSIAGAVTLALLGSPESAPQRFGLAGTVGSIAVMIAGSIVLGSRKGNGGS